MTSGGGNREAGPQAIRSGARRKMGEWKAIPKALFPTLHVFGDVGKQFDPGIDSSALSSRVKLARQRVEDIIGRAVGFSRERLTNQNTSVNWLTTSRDATDK